MVRAYAALILAVLAIGALGVVRLVTQQDTETLDGSRMAASSEATDDVDEPIAPRADSSVLHRGPVELVWEAPVGTQVLAAVPDLREGVDVVWVAAGDTGLIALDPETIEVVSRLFPISFRGLSVTNAAQQADLLYLSLGDFLAPDGSRHGLAIIDISDPSKPDAVGVWVSDHVGTGSAHVTVLGGTAYLSAMDDGLAIVDVSDSTTPALVGRFIPDVDFPSPDPGAIRMPSARSSELYDGRLVVANGTGGLRLLDLSEPIEPVEVAAYINPDAVDVRHSYNDIEIRFGLAYVATDQCGLEVVDLTDAADLRQVGWWNPWRCDKPLNLWGNSDGHGSQLVLDAQRSEVVLAAGDSDLFILDVSNPSSPTVKEVFGLPGDGFGTRGVGLAGNELYLTFLTTSSPFEGTWSGVKRLDRQP